MLANREYEIKARVSVAEILSHYNIHVNKCNFANCIFHKDNHPSMKVNEQYVKCFSCGESADVIKIVMKIENCNFQDAMQFIDSKYRLGLFKELTQEDKKKFKEELKKRELEKKKKEWKEKIQKIITNNIMKKIRYYEELDEIACKNKEDRENFNFSRHYKIQEEIERLDYLYCVMSRINIDYNSRFFYIYGDSYSEIGNNIYKKIIKI